MEREILNFGDKYPILMYLITIPVALFFLSLIGVGIGAIVVLIVSIFRCVILGEGC